MPKSKNIAITHELNRILIYLEDINTPVNVTKISEDCCMARVTAKDALAFLIKHKLIIKYRMSGYLDVTYYKFINKNKRKKNVKNKNNNN